MDPDRSRRAREIADHARDSAPDDRERILTDACGDDAELRLEVERLLASETAADERPTEAAEAGAGSGTAAGPTRRIGPYRLVRILGEGGMGIVYEAEQEYPVRRRVALKSIKHGLDGEQILARFEAERQALAMMKHPNVAGILDAGSDADGRPYFVMEHIAGVPLTDYCDRHDLGTGERLELMIQVCAGVQHAHQKGVIHRDLKPSNILVEVRDGKPVPRIIDFGVARAIDRQLAERSIFTEFGQMVGTPEYMSPEQAEMSVLDIDTRTDVYSLGVVLYELLVGALPFDSRELRAAGYEEMRRRIREVTPPRPSTRVSGLGDTSEAIAARRRVDPKTLERTCRGDLDWITMKALDKDRARRYGSPAEFAEDLRRHLANEPVSAGPPSAAYRARKFVRRHRIGVAFAASIAVAIVGGLVGTTYGMVRAIQAERRTRFEAETVRQVADFMVGIFEVTNPSESRGRTVTAKEVLDRGASRIDVELRERPALQSRLTESMGLAYKSLGLYTDSEPLLRAAVSGQARATGAGSAETARAKTTLAGLLVNRGKLDEAYPLLEEALRLQEATLAPDDPELARTLNNLGSVLRTRKEYDKAMPFLERALAIREKRYGPESLEVAKQLANLGSARIWTKDFEGARRDLGRALAIREKVWGADHVQVAATLDDLATLERKADDLVRAQALAERALAIEEKALGPGHPDLVNTLTNLGIIARGRGDAATSRRYLERALAIAEATLEPGQRDREQASKELATTLKVESAAGQ